MTSDHPSPVAPSPVAALDLDGVLADTRHRLHYVDHHPKDWEAFFAAAAEDSVHAEGRAVLTELMGRGFEPVYLTGRPHRLEQATLRWLEQHGLPAAPLLMRADPDRRPAATVKITHLRRLARHRTVAVLVDDDPDVVGEVRRIRPALVTSVLLADWQPRDPVTPRAQRRLGRT